MGSDIEGGGQSCQGAIEAVKNLSAAASELFMKSLRVIKDNFVHSWRNDHSADGDGHNV